MERDNKSLEKMNWESVFPHFQMWGRSSRMKKSASEAHSHNIDKLTDALATSC